MFRKDIPPGLSILSPIKVLPMIGLCNCRATAATWQTKVLLLEQAVEQGCVGGSEFEQIGIIALNEIEAGQPGAY